MIKVYIDYSGALIKRITVFGVGKEDIKNIESSDEKEISFWPTQHGYYSIGFRYQEPNESKSCEVMYLPIANTIVIIDKDQK